MTFSMTQTTKVEMEEEVRYEIEGSGLAGFFAGRDSQTVCPGDRGCGEGWEGGPAEKGIDLEYDNTGNFSSQDDIATVIAMTLIMLASIFVVFFKVGENIFIMN